MHGGGCRCRPRAQGRPGRESIGIARSDKWMSKSGRCQLKIGRGTTAATVGGKEGRGKSMMMLFFKGVVVIAVVIVVVVAGGDVDGIECLAASWTKARSSGGDEVWDLMGLGNVLGRRGVCRLEAILHRKRVEI